MNQPRVGDLRERQFQIPQAAELADLLQFRVADCVASEVQSLQALKRAELFQSAIIERRNLKV